MKAASPVTVDLYRLAYNAGRAITLDELVDGIPSAYQNDANRWFVEKQKAEGIELKPDPWPPRMLRTVKTKWVKEQVQDMLGNKHFKTEHPDGRPIRSGPFHLRMPSTQAVKERPPGRNAGRPTDGVGGISRSPSGPVDA